MHSKIFSIGFLFGITLFIAVNVYSYAYANPPCCDFGRAFGVPITLGSYGGFVGGLHIKWSGVIADMLIATGASYILGFIVESIFRQRIRLS